MVVEYEIGEPIDGADGGTNFGDKETNANFKWGKIVIEGGFQAPAKFATNVLSREDSVWFYDPIAGRFDKTNLGVLKVDFRDYYLSGVDGEGEGAYVAVGLHHHIGNNLSAPNLIDIPSGKLNEWTMNGGHEQASALLCPGIPAEDWSGNRDGLADSYVMGTMMTNITNFTARDTDGNVKPNVYYDNSGNEVDLETYPEAEQKGVIRLCYFKIDDANVDGYYSMMIP